MHSEGGGFATGKEVSGWCGAGGRCTNVGTEISDKRCPANANVGVDLNVAFEGPRGSWGRPRLFGTLASTQAFREAGVAVVAHVYVL